MRQAVVVAPPRFELPAKGSVFAAPAPVGPVCAALARGGRRLMLVPAGANLAWDFEQALAQLAPEDDVVVYVAAATTRGDGAGGDPRPALRIGDEPGSTVLLRTLSDIVLAQSPAGVSFIVEAGHDGEDDPMVSAEHVGEVLHALDARARGYGVLVGVRPERRATSAPWPFTRHLLAALEDPASRDDCGAARFEHLHELLRSRGALDADVQSFALVKARVDFPLIEPPMVSDVAPRPASAASFALIDPPAEAPHDDSWDDAPAAAPDVAAIRGAGPAVAPTPTSTADAATAADPGAAADPVTAGHGAAADHGTTADPGAAADPGTAANPGAAADPVAATDPGPTADPAAADAGPAPAPAAAALAPAPAAEPPPPTPPPSEPLSSADLLAVSSERAPEPIPEPRPSLPSSPMIEPLLDLAEGARQRGELVQALAGYKAALLVVGPDDKPTLARVHARIGQIQRTQGKLREAERAFERAIALDATESLALDGLVELATEEKETRRAIEWRRMRLDNDRHPDDRVAELVAIAEAHAESGDLRAAGAALDEAAAVASKGPAAVARLRAVNEKWGRWAAVVGLVVELAEGAEDAKEKSARLVEAATLSGDRARDRDGALRLLRRALDADPTNDGAFDTLVGLHTSAGEWESLDALYARRVDRLAPAGDVERVWDACRKLAMVRRDRLRDLPGALDAFTGAVRCKPDDAESRAMLAEAHLGLGDEAQAIGEFERIAAIAPLRPAAYARLFALHRRAGHTDRAWLAGAALEELGSADMDQQLVVDQFRLDGPIRPTRSLDDAAWDELLRAPGSDEVIVDVLRAIAEAAAAARVEDLRQARQLVTLDPARRQSVASTVTAVRSFQWAAQVLAVPAPELYVLDDLPGGIAAVPTAAPATALGPDVLRGLTTKDLAFLAARHLTYYRPEYSALIHYPTLDDFSALFLGAVKIALPDLPVPAPLHDTVAHIRKAVARQLTDESRRRLANAVARLHERDGRADLPSFIRSVELTAQRAGLLLCGDLSVATARLRAEAGSRAIAELTFDEKRADLLSFCASEALGRARELLGVGARRSVGPAGELAAS